MTLISPETVYRRTLPNGLRVLVRRDTTAPVVAIVTHVSAGYFDETDDVIGIAHVLEHMFFKGTPTRGVGEIARQTKAVGGYLNAATIYDHTLYYAVVPSSGFVSALEIQADAYRNSLIDGDELARELEVIIQEAKRKVDNPAAVSIETMYELLHDRHRIRRWRIGREEGLRRLGRDHLMKFYRNFYAPSDTILVVVGDVEPADTFDQVQRLYGDIPAIVPQRTPGPDEDRDPGFRYRELSGDIAQTQLAFGWRTPGTLHADSATLDMLATVLGSGRASRLYRATRERKLVSGIAAFNYTPRDIGVFAIQAEAPPEKAPAAIDATWDQLRRLRDEGAGTLELERARRITQSRWVRRLEDMEGQATYLAEWEALGNWELGERYFERMLAASADDLRDVQLRYLRDDQTSLLVYRPERAASVATAAEAMRERLDQAKAEPLEAAARVEQQAVAQNGGAPEREREVSGVHVYRLPSGVPVLVRRRPGSPITYAGVFALGGASAEHSDIGGRTLLMARTALKGTRRRSAVQIAEDGELLGGSVGAMVGADSVGWTISVPAPHSAAAVELLADVAQHPVFEVAAVETERAIALADLAALRDDMYRYPMRLAIQAAFPGHPYGVPSLGTENSLRVHTREDLAMWHGSQLLDAPSVVAIVGDGEPDELAAIAGRHFRDLRYRAAAALPTPAWPPSITELVEERDKAQTALVISWPAPGRTDLARFDVAILSGVASGLGGRLFEELRDKQSLCYTVHAFGSERRAAGTFNAYIATSPEKEEVARDGLLSELEKLRNEPVTDEELRRAQTYAIGVHAIRQQSGGAVLGEVVDAWMFGSLAELDEHDDRIRAVTAASMRETAKRYFEPLRRVEGIVRGVGKQV
ncbi:MAG TPA: pitrilysin family protein [Gemmatimonadaceae bacterium]|nr:pitrilysin family protein [Gemmatimonadaceae bacterium]